MDQPESVLLTSNKDFSKKKNTENDLLCKFNKLSLSNMSTKDKLKTEDTNDDVVCDDVSIQQLDDDEKLLLRKAGELFKKFLKVHKRPEEIQRRVMQRAIAFMAMYSRRAGKENLQKAVSSTRNFVNFLVLINEVVRSSLSLMDNEKNVALSRAPHLKNRDAFGASDMEWDSTDLPPEYLENLLLTFEHDTFLPDLNGMDFEDLLNPPSVTTLECNDVIYKCNKGNIPINISSPGDGFVSSPSCSLSPYNNTCDSPAFSPTSLPPPYALYSPGSTSPSGSPPLTVSSGRSSSMSMEQGLSNMNISPPNSAIMMGQMLSASSSATSSNLTSRRMAIPQGKSAGLQETAREELLLQIHPQDKEKSRKKIADYSEEKLLSSIKADEDGDTGLMLAYANQDVSLADLFNLTERLRKFPRLFLEFNKFRQNALFFAVTEKKDKPYIAGYLAETMASLNLTLDHPYSDGNTILHLISRLGDPYAKVLEYLLRIRTPDGNAAFKINALNHSGRTPLHEAVLYHGPNFSCFEIIKLFLAHGADPAIQETTSGRTCVHDAVKKQDYEILYTLLTAFPHAANAPDYNENTPLHTAAALHHGVSEKDQLTLVQLLLVTKADKSRRNKANKLPIELVPQSRPSVKQVLMARQKH